LWHRPGIQASFLLRTVRRSGSGAPPDRFREGHHGAGDLDGFHCSHAVTGG
jgi:hypothetical protein